MHKVLQFALLLLVVSTVGLAADAAPMNAVPNRTVYDAVLKNGFSIHHLRHETDGTLTRLYTDDKSYIDVPTSEISEISESQEAVPAPSNQSKRELNIPEAVSAASDKHQIDPDLINAVIHAESAFNPRAKSPKGAQGLMQLMPGTAATLGVEDPYDPASNVDAGTQFLRELLLKYDGDMVKALAAYNAGPGRVARYHGVPPYPETRAYVARIVKEFNQKKLAAKKATNKTAPSAEVDKSHNAGQ